MASKASVLPDQLSSLYKRWVLDSIITSALAVAKDFSNRPELYQEVDSAVAGNFTEIQSRYGYDPKFPNDEQRRMLLKPIFGSSDGNSRIDESSPFHEGFE